MSAYRRVSGVPVGVCRLVGAAVATLLVGGVLAGCGGGTPASTDPPSPGSATPSVTASVSPSVPPSSAAPSTPAADPAYAPLLTVADLPSPASGGWTERQTRRDPPTPFGSCGRFALTSIGATRVVTRTFAVAPAGVPQAAEAVADFPDASTTGRAVQVLDSWHDRCATQGRSVSAQTALDLAAGPASGYVVTARDGTRRAVGVVVVGKRIALVELPAPPAGNPLATLVPVLSAAAALLS